MKGTTAAEFADEVDLDHPLSKRRVPVLHGSHPRWKYHVAVVINPDGGVFRAEGVGLEPTPEEVEQLVAYLDYRLTYYNLNYRQKMLARPFDLDDAVNTYSFRKDPELGWTYNMATWVAGPTWVPSRYPEDSRRFPTLEALIDHIHTYGGELYHRWAEFKATSPAFGKG